MALFPLSFSLLFFLFGPHILAFVALMKTFVLFSFCFAPFFLFVFEPVIERMCPATKCMNSLFLWPGL